MDGGLRTARGSHLSLPLHRMCLLTGAGPGPPRTRTASTNASPSAVTAKRAGSHDRAVRDLGTQSQKLLFQLEFVPLNGLFLEIKLHCASWSVHPHGTCIRLVFCGCPLLTDSFSGWWELWGGRKRPHAGSCSHAEWRRSHRPPTESTLATSDNEHSADCLLLRRSVTEL